MIRLRGRKVSAEVRAFVGWLQTVIEFEHEVEIHICRKLHGFFDAPGKHHGYGPYAVVAANDEILTTIAHECVHYEQWRDKRDQNERGVEQRARALVRQWRRERGA